MRFFKQLLLLLVAVVIVNALRFRPAPAQGNGPPPARSGDTNCDGKIDITDPIIVLNWLFSDGPEPCAIAQGDGCCESVQEQITALRAEVAAIAGRTPGPDDIVFLTGRLRFTTSETKTILEVPEGKRFIITSFASNPLFNDQLRLVSIANGTSTNVLAPLYNNGGRADWPSGRVWPAGSNVGMSLEYEPAGLLLVDYDLNGYFVAE